MGRSIRFVNNKLKEMLGISIQNILVVFVLGAVALTFSVIFSAMLIHLLIAIGII